MRVTIEHREEAGGLHGRRRAYFIDWSVVFSEEERAIIRARDLYDRAIEVRAATPLPSQVAILRNSFIRKAGGLLAAAAPIVGIADGIHKMGLEGPSYLMLVGGICMMIYGRRQSNQQEIRLADSKQSVPVRQLLATGRFTVHAFDPAHAKALAEEVGAALAELSNIIKGSAELQPTQTFEL